MYRFLRPFLFRLDPETTHQLTLWLMRIGGIEPIHSILRTIYSVPSKPVNAFGLTFRNPVGLAAGYDKDAVVIKGLSALGFGHMEVGTVTPTPQPGNPRPRLFRLPEDEAVINRLGFPSQGADFVVSRLKRLNIQTFEHANAVVGTNLGKNKDTPLEEAGRDYVQLMNVFAPLADYLTINISSPNTVGLRRLQGREMLENLLNEINSERQTWNLKRPILVKIAPDLSEEELDETIGAILDNDMDGIIATNTTVGREGLRSKHRGETGGLSGRPLRARSEAVLRQAMKLVNGKIPIVSAGGIMTPEDAKHRLDLGATLIQLYTGLIYHGPGLVKKILEQ
ncbi:MAG TPA: quinone-dependent dihydroorotate dehydrogenase [Anaerolineales bacterium]|nr:quinone-dependent dihydroorotate dehydrogenase [Anaerolineales bacterium]